GVRTARTESHASTLRATYISTADIDASSSISAPAANARSDPATTMQWTAGSASSSWSAETSSDISSEDSAFSCSGRLSVTVATGGALVTRTYASVIALVDEAPNSALCLLAEHAQREPVARMADGRVPGKVAPIVELVLRVARRLRKLRSELLDEVVDRR